MQRYQWGFTELEINTQYLYMGKIALTHAAGLFPDGTLFDATSANAPPVIDIAPGTTDTTVYLALSLAPENKQETRRPDNEEIISRSVSYETTAVDTTSTEQQTYPITCSRLDLRLQIGEKENPDWVKLPVCHINESAPDGSIQLSEDFQPSFLNTHASDFIYSALEELVNSLSHRGKQIADRLHTSKAVSSAEVGDFLMLQVINKALPQLNHWLNVDIVHPEILYIELLSLLGELSTYGETRIPKEGLVYQHSDQGRCFAEAFDELRNLLSQVLEQYVIEHALTRKKIRHSGHTDRR